MFLFQTLTPCPPMPRPHVWTTDSSGTIILPEQDPVKEKQPKIQTKQSQRKANAECPDTMAPGGTSQVCV